MRAHEFITELQGVKSHLTRFPTKKAFFTYMADQGFQLLGAGNSGAVFDHPKFQGRYVMKCFTDRAYEGFVRYAMAHQDNPHLPRFFGDVIKVSANGRIVRTERLTPMTKVAQRHAFRLLAKTETHIKGQIDYDTLTAWFTEDQDEGLVQTFLSIPDADDLHEENMMMRGEIIVITDPYGGGDFGW
jgi:hypothetical protein